MLQPFERFKFVAIERLQNMNRPYLVSQTYKRAFDHLADHHPIDILLSDYDDPGLAKIHLNAVRQDKYASIINLTHHEHVKTLLGMLEPDSKYRVFWSVVKSAKELEDRIDNSYKDNMRRYIEKHTNWNISRSTKLYPSVQVTFGELYIVLKFGNQTLRLKFEEIEKI